MVRLMRQRSVADGSVRISEERFPRVDRSYPGVRFDIEAATMHCADYDHDKGDFRFYQHD